MARAAAPRRIHPRDAHSAGGQPGHRCHLRRAGGAVLARTYGAGSPAGAPAGPRRGAQHAGDCRGCPCRDTPVGEREGPARPQRLAAPLHAISSEDHAGLSRPGSDNEKSRRFAAAAGRAAAFFLLAGPRRFCGLAARSALPSPARRARSAPESARCASGCHRAALRRSPCAGLSACSATPAFRRRRLLQFLRRLCRAIGREMCRTILTREVGSPPLS